MNINITDTNDNRPIFQVPIGGYTVSISEDTEIGFEVITVVATDVDQGTNMEITYTIDSRNGVPFTINNSSVSYYGVFCYGIGIVYTCISPCLLYLVYTHICAHPLYLQ